MARCGASGLPSGGFSAVTLYPGADSTPYHLAPRAPDMPDDTGPRMEVRALLAVVLSMVVLTLYQYFFVPPAPDPGLAGETPPFAGELAPAGGRATEGGAQEEAGGATAPGPSEVDPERAIGAAAALELRLIGAKYEATLTNVGGRVSSFLLPGYEDDEGRTIDLVHPGARAMDELMLGLVTPAGPELAGAANAALYALLVDGVESSGGTVQVGGEPVRVELVWSDGAAWEVRKELVFPPAGTQVGLKIQASAPGGMPVYVGLGPGLNAVPGGGRNVFLREGPLLLRLGAGTEKWDADDLEAPVELTGGFRWAGLESHYFLGAFLLESQADVRLARVTVPSLAGGATGEPDPTAEVEVLELGRVEVEIPHAGLDSTVFLGPKLYRQLAAEGHELQRAVDFGWFGIIARPLLYALVWIESFVGNYGVAIILLTALLRVAFLPLNHKAMVSMRKTQQLQPKMAAIRAKYKGSKDIESRQKMNEEVMELYRKEGVSPFGGCLPMLAQMPLLFAFYRLLSVAIELRGAPFALWIQDLSKHDPYLVLPLLMGGTMLLQQRMTPAAGGNPAQARMMRLMPVLFTVLFLYVPSGLVLYWTVNNILGIGQQVYVNRSTDTTAPPAKSKGKRNQGQRGKR